MPVYGFPFFLEDKTGELTGSDFVDLHDRMRFSLRCTMQDANRTVYMIYDTSNGAGAVGARVREPAAVLEYGPGGALGFVTIGASAAVTTTDYLRRTSLFGRCAGRCARSLCML